MLVGQVVAQPDRVFRCPPPQTLPLAGELAFKPVTPVLEAHAAVGFDRDAEVGTIDFFFDQDIMSKKLCHFRRR